MVALPPRRLASCGLFVVLACGPSSTDVDGDGSGGTAGASGTSDDAADHDASGADDASGTGNGTETTGDAVTCPESDLPEPFCHRFVAMPLEETERWVGYVDQVRDGVRPLILHDEEADVLRLVSPVDPSVVLVEGPVPGGLPEDWEIPLTADFNGDGVFDFAAYDPGANTAASDPQDVALVDGAAFEIIGVLPQDEAAWVRRNAALDVDADGSSELVALEVFHSEKLVLNAWHPSGGQLDLIATTDILPGVQPYERVLQGDFNGDGLTDLTIVWTDGSEPYWVDDPPQIYTILAPSSPGAGVEVTESPHPAWARSAAVADMNGDGDFEVVIAAGSYEILVMDWDGAGFVESETLALPEGYTSSMAGVGAGKFVPPGLGGVLVSGVGLAGTPSSLFNVALFPEAVGTPALLQFEGHPAQSYVADFNADGTDDLRGGNSNVLGLYLSNDSR